MADKTDELHWRETYFILFPHSRRPSLEKIEHALGGPNSRMKLENLAADDNGLVESLLIESPEDHAAVEVSYEVGDAVIEQNLEWAKQLQKTLPAEQLQLLMTSDARLDVAHFERLASGAPTSGDTSTKSSSTRRPDVASPRFADFGDDPYGDEFGDAAADDSWDDDDAEPDMEMLDPTCLLTVVETLASLTHGLTFDPAAGEMMD